MNWIPTSERQPECRGKEIVRKNIGAQAIMERNRRYEELTKRITGGERIVENKTTERKEIWH